MPDALGERLRSGRPDPRNSEADYLLAPPCGCRSSDEVPLGFTG